jgi:membrane-associated phospholipid phosphatase
MQIPRLSNLLIVLGAAIMLLWIVVGIIQQEFNYGAIFLGIVVCVIGLYQRMIRKSGGPSFKLWPLAAYAIVWFLFTFLRAFADDVGFPNQGELAAAIDRLIGFGATPTERFQSWLFTPGEVGFADRLTVFVHVSYFGVPHLLAIALWLHQSPRMAALFASYLRMTIMVLGFGLALYMLLPTSPPWLQAGEYGPLDLERVIWTVNQSDAGANEQVYGVVTDPNPIAAMPSLHTAITVLAAVVAWRVNRWFGLLAAFYAALMGFSLVYLGEHFVIDVLAGLGLTGGVIALERALANRWSGYRAFGYPRRQAETTPGPTVPVSTRPEGQTPGRSAQPSC